MRLSGSVFSKTLDMDTGVTIVTPNDLRPGQSYAVVYLLHGLCGDCRTWLEYSMLPAYAAEGRAVYVMPEVQRSFYHDMRHGPRYFTYITEELPAICESLFHISARREDTAVMGCSMGGYGALRCALSMPQRYGMCAAFSSGGLFLAQGLSALRENGLDPAIAQRFGAQLAEDFRAVFGEDYACGPQSDLVSLLQSAAGANGMPRLYLACGRQDPFYQDHLAFQEALSACGADYALDFWDAQHDFAFFSDALKKAIDYFAL